MRHRRSAATNRKLAEQDARRLAAQAAQARQARATHDLFTARSASANRKATSVPATNSRDTAPLAYHDRPFSMFR